MEGYRGVIRTLISGCEYEPISRHVQQAVKVIKKVINHSNKRFIRSKKHNEKFIPKEDTKRRFIKRYDI